ncbi:RepB family plasmid replication initiator protein, partial [Acinetobacter baumannii]|uniref:RepB family plasmid replication initiator protein n=1 Tax=Acinetobacter baumannii TaxID=470 RepID=UPI0011C4D86B
SYINQFGVHRNTAYQSLKDACKYLFARQFIYKEKKSNVNIRNVIILWVYQIAYNDNEANVDLIFATAVVPFITRLEEQFTKYELQQVSSLSSAYAIRLY